MLIKKKKQNRARIIRAKTDVITRNAVILEYMPLVYSAMSGFQFYHIERQDVLHDCVEVLITCINNYNQTKNKSFGVYAKSCLIHQLKSMTRDDSIVKPRTNGTRIFSDRYIDNVDDVEEDSGDATDYRRFGWIAQLTEHEDNESRVDIIDFLSNLLDEVKSLTAQQRYILAKHYGLCGRTRTSLETIGIELKTTKQNVHRLEKAAIRKIRLHVLKNGVRYYA